jgi:hypothetical protein
MLKITIPAGELYDEVNNEFINCKEQTLQLEHSLVSLSKWESKWHKPFLSKETKTNEESADYVRCMTLTQNVDQNIYKFVTDNIIEQVTKYIEEPMTATTFKKNNKSINHDVITAEVIYYWMVIFNIPFECQKWHLNRLITLIDVCNEKSKQPKNKKMTNQDLMNRAALNEMRRQQLHSNG